MVTLNDIPICQLAQLAFYATFVAAFVIRFFCGGDYET